MADLLFFTDRYPYNNSEAFIENEISIMSSYYDNVYILPCGLMVDTDTIRNVPSNVHVLPPATCGTIYTKKPSYLKKIFWATKNLYIWIIACLFNGYFYKELSFLLFNIGFTIPRLLKIFRTLAPALRNRFHFKKELKKYGITEYYAYSYWIEPTVLFANDILPDAIIKKVFCRTHRWDLYIEESPINYLAFQKQIINFVDKVYVISKDGVEYLKKIYPNSKSKILLSRLGTIDRGLNPKEKDDVYRVVSCSNIIPVKRVELIIEILRMLSLRHLNIEWIHFGTGQYFDQINEYAKSQLRNVHYEFKGLVPNYKIMEFYLHSHIDLFVNVSLSEGIPVSIMEACSCGIPVVATNVGGTGEIVHDGLNGFLLEKNFTVDDVVNKIECLMQEDIAEKMRAESRLIWEKNYNCTVNYTEFYNSIGK